jgi:hypothetical protein
LNDKPQRVARPKSPGLLELAEFGGLNGSSTKFENQAANFHVFWVEEIAQRASFVLCVKG